MKNNIILIGFMGAGKTSVGKALARVTGMPLLDTDQMIEKEAGMTISRIFAEQGEDAFRAAETRVLETLLEKTDDSVISVGGGLPLREENRELLNKIGSVVYLRVRPETVLYRLRGDSTRPLLQGENVEQKVRDLLDVRGPIYAAAADRILDVDDKTPQQLAELLKK